MSQLTIDDATHVLVLTGAGVSAESGIPTFRGAGGLWEGYPIEDVASPRGFREHPALVWRFYSQRREGARVCEPNAGHRALVELERRLGDRFLLATQNVDGLHRRAGSDRLVEMHGCLYRSRCTVCVRPAFDDHQVYAEGVLPSCDRCAERGRSAMLRPDIVWFGEMLDPADLARIDAFVRNGRGERLVFLAAGTSGVVYPAAGMVDMARAAGAETWLVNAEAADNVSRFEHFVQGPSGRVLPSLLGIGLDVPLMLR